jgi:hypothetical protein
MRLRLEVPATAKPLARLTLLQWSKAEGEPIAFGDDVCVLAVGGKVMLNRQPPVLARARRTKRLLGRKTPGEPGHRTLTTVGVVLRVKASDEGVLRRQLLEPGEEVATGTLLGLVTTTADEPVDGDPMGAPVFRAIAESDAVDADDDGFDPMVRGTP